MPYASKAQIEYEFVEDHIELYVTFAKPMDRYVRPLDEEPYTPLLPPLDKFILEVDDIPVDIISASWQDIHTLKLISDEVLTAPEITTLAYNGPDIGLQTSWQKQWEPWGAIVCSVIPGSEFKTGMIIIWSGSSASIPAGWHLCDGSESTPDLRNRFIVGAGDTYNVGNSGGTYQHTHTIPQHSHYSNAQPGSFIASGNNFDEGFPTSEVTVYPQNSNHLPPYYALCYIMKL